MFALIIFAVQTINQMTMKKTLAILLFIYAIIISLAFTTG